MCILALDKAPCNGSHTFPSQYGSTLDSLSEDSLRYRLTPTAVRSTSVRFSHTSLAPGWGARQPGLIPASGTQRIGGTCRLLRLMHFLFFRRLRCDHATCAKRQSPPPPSADMTRYQDPIRTLLVGQEGQQSHGPLIDPMAAAEDRHQTLVSAFRS